MNFSRFNEIVSEQIGRCELMLTSKGRGYAPECILDNDGIFEADRLAHFKKAAALQGCSQEQALFGMLAKHLVSVADMVGDNKEHDLTTWNEKITDSINYLLILRAMVTEDADGGPHEKAG